MSTLTLDIEKRKTLVPQLRFHEFEVEWKLNRLGEIAKIITGSTPSTLIDEYYNGKKLFVSPADIQENRYVYKTKTTLTEKGFAQGRKVKKGSVLFVCIGSTIGKVAQATEECLTNQQINSLESNLEYSNDFIYELLEKNGEKIKLLAGVQAVPQINKTDFSNFKYFVPALPEQQKIASFLSAVDEKIQQLSRKKELLEQYKKGVMQQLFCGKLRFKDENGKDYPDWEEKKLGDVGKIRMCKRIFSYETSEKGEIPFYKIGTFGKEADAFITKELYLFYKEKFSFPKTGEILLSASGTLGRTVIYNGSPSYFQDSNIVWIENNEKITTNSFLYFIYQIVRYDSEGGTIQRLYNSIISKTKFKNPSIPEQQKIANFLSSIDTKIESTKKQITQTQKFKKGLLQQMFV